MWLLWSSFRPKPAWAGFIQFTGAGHSGFCQKQRLFTGAFADGNGFLESRPLALEI
jgi:hypothetical protein